MTYQNVLDQVFSKKRHYLRSSLELPLALSAALDHPHTTFPSVHVVGTNGKGSVSTKIAKVLELSGLRVGLFTSPHLFCFRERIVINGVKISEERACALLSYLMPLAEKIYPQSSFFDLATFLAFLYFKEEKVDIAVIEAGVGGLLDTTNIIHPLLTIITSVGYDHEAILGCTLEEIARHKAGAIKPETPTVLGPTAAQQAPVIQRALLCRSPIFSVLFQPRFYDEENQAIAAEAIQLLRSRFTLMEQAIKEGLKARPPCRFEVQGNVILDVAHNPNGLRRLLEALDIHFPGCLFKVILGLSNDKDIGQFLKMLLPRASHIFLVQAATPRAASVAEMAKILQQENYPHFTTGQTVAEALDLTRDELVVVCGTFYIMQEVRDHIIRSEVGVQ